MAEERIEHTGEPVPPAGEAVHLPGPSFLPVIVAAGVSLAVVGVVISWILVALGVVIIAIAVMRWIRETRESVSELPLEH
jgi:Flp pilus assembly protein TadB